MPPTELPLQALTIYLLREDQDPKKAIKRSASVRRIEVDEKHVLFSRRSKERHPTWVKFFSGAVDADEFGKARSSGALLLCEVQGRYFAMTFGTGRFLLDPLSIEQRFGLMVTLNAVDPRKVRSIDTASLDRQGMQSRRQASRDATARDFGFDIEQDLVRAVAGTPIDGLIGETIAGFDALHVNARMAFSDLRDRLEIYLEKSRQKTYQKEFGWIDHIREVRERAICEKLDRAVTKEMKSGKTSNIWMAPDGIIDWAEVSYFQFGGASKTPRFSTLSLDRFIEHVGGAAELSVDDIRARKVRALRADDSIAHEWPVSRCLQAEIQYGQKSFLLSAGKWYQVDDRFVESVNAIVRNVPTIKSTNLGLPEYEHKNERAYNQAAVAGSGGKIVLMDADNVRQGGGSSQIEFCDLYSLGRDIIHVKRYSGSSTLSHLFSQATVSGQNFKSDALFREKVNEKLPVSHKIADVQMPLGQDEYRVVIAIAGGAGSNELLPFFSRVTLKNSYKLLSAYGYEVVVSHIPFEEHFEKLAAFREGRRRQLRVARKSSSRSVIPVPPITSPARFPKRP